MRLSTRCRALQAFIHEVPVCGPILISDRPAPSPSTKLGQLGAPTKIINDYLMSVKQVSKNSQGYSAVG